MSDLFKNSFLYSFGTLVYIVLVATIMHNAERIFGQMNDVFGPVGFLLLFTLSALVVGTLILGKPLMLYIDGKKKDAVKLLLANINWLAIFTILILLILAWL